MINRIIVSSDDSDFLNFWPIVSKAWNRILPESKITLAFVTNRDINDPIFKSISLFGEVYIFPEDPSIPSANQAKICRHILASLFTNQISMIEDIDTIPLQKDFINKIISEFDPEKILLVGSEVYNNTSSEGKIPISNMTAEGSLFSLLFDPNKMLKSTLKNNIFSPDVFKIWEDWKYLNVFDSKESIMNIPDESGKLGFSDESLIRALIDNLNFYHKVKKIKRDIDTRNKWIDRSWWDVDESRLRSEDYVLCNFLRPIRSNYNTCKSVIDFIYGYNTTDDLFLI
jgi:hypothetical protein